MITEKKSRLASAALLGRIYVREKCDFLQKEDPTQSPRARLAGALGGHPLLNISILHQFWPSLLPEVPQANTLLWQWLLKSKAEPGGTESFPESGFSAGFPQWLLPWTLAPLIAENGLLQGFLGLFWLKMTQGYLLIFMHSVILNIENILIAEAGLFCTV